MGWPGNLIYWFYKIIWAGWRIHICATNYHYISNISRTKPQNLTFLVSSCSCFCPIHWSQVLSRKWKVPSNGNIFCVTGPLCGQFTGHRWIPLTKVSETEFFYVFFDLHLTKRLSKKSWVWWFETPSCSLWRHCNEVDSAFTQRP